MSQYILKDGDQVYTTGAYLERDSTVEGGWKVMVLDSDTFMDGELVNGKVGEDGNMVYYTGDEDEQEDDEEIS